MPVDPWILVMALAVTFLAATVQGTVGFGLAVISVPVLSLLDRDLAPVPQLLMALILGILMVWRERTELDLSGVGWVMLGRVPGAALGLLLIKIFADNRALDGLIAVLVLLAVVALASGATVPVNRLTQAAAGVASGITSLVASIGGPPLALLYRNYSGGRLRSSLNAIFVLGITLSIIVRGSGGEINADDVRIAAALLPAALLGLWVSRFLTGKVEGRRLKTGVLVVSGLAALGLLGRSVLG